MSKIIHLDTPQNRLQFPEFFSDRATNTRKLETLIKQIGIDVVNGVAKEGNLDVGTALKITATAAEIIGIVQANREHK
jgi:hypothetical protein